MNKPTVLNKLCSDAIYHIDTGSSISYLRRAEVLGGQADEAVRQLQVLGIVEVDGTYIKAKWHSCNIRFSSEHGVYVFGGQDG